MAENIFYHSIIRKHIIAFGSLFNQIYFERPDTTGTTQQTIKVPLSYGPKEWYLSRQNVNPALTNPINPTLPRIAFQLVSLRYANERKLNTTNVKQTSLNQPDTARTRIMAPVPYDLHIRMTILTRNSDDATRIVEQIVPRFTPELTISLKSVPEMDISNDVPIVLSNVELDDSYEGSMSEDDRTIIWNLDFVMKASFYGPMATQGIIKAINLNFIDMDTSSLLEALRIIPGLTAAGLPTNDPAQSIPPSQISKDENWGFILEFIGAPN